MTAMEEKFGPMTMPNAKFPLEVEEMTHRFLDAVHILQAIATQCWLACGDMDVPLAHKDGTPLTFAEAWAITESLGPQIGRADTIREMSKPVDDFLTAFRHGLANEASVRASRIANPDGWSLSKRAEVHQAR
jgi:hypothetical protein